jgi:hypothetical protein
VTVTDVLTYQTSDPRFAERAVQALQHAEIPCYRTGSGYAELQPGLNLDYGCRLHALPSFSWLFY